MPHNHVVADVTDFPVTMPPDAHNHVVADVTDFPATMPPSEHSHDYSEITGTPPSGGGSAEVGSIVMYGGGPSPTGWVFCDGAEYPTSTYPALYSVIGETFGSSGAGLFCVPDFQGVFPVGAGNGYALAAEGGEGVSHTHYRYNART